MCQLTSASYIISIYILASPLEDLVPCIIFLFSKSLSALFSLVISVLGPCPRSGRRTSLFILPVFCLSVRQGETSL